MRLFLLKIGFFILAAIAALPALSAYAGELSGLAEWNYADFRSSGEGEPSFDAHHFWQEYSLMYRTEGKFLEGRAGAWKLSAGAQWLGLEGEYDGGISEDRFKPLYEGDVLIAPGGLPFRLHLYHRDTDLSRATSYETGSIRSPYLRGPGTPRSRILSPSIATSIDNGTTVESGASLLVGIRNGSYRGRYRNVLSRFPRLLMDYRQTMVKDLNAFAPQHYRQRELAFVSLNKKNNWFHYRYSDYENYLDAGDGWTEKQYILGTITAGLRRHWIQMTNWLQVSADGTYSQVESTEEARTSRNNGDEFALNLFGMGRRTSWEGSTFTNYTRETGGTARGIEKRLSVPLYLQGEIDANTAWRFRFEGNQEDQTEGVDENRLFSSAQLEAFREQRYRLTNKVSLERENRTNVEYNRARAGFELFSNRDFNPRTSYRLSYDLSYFSSSSEATETQFLENSARLSMEKRPTSRFLWGVSQGLTYGSGDLSSDDDGTIQSASGESLSRRDVTNRQQDRSGDVWRSTSEIHGEYSAGRRHSNGLSLTYEYLSENGASSDRVLASHRYSYSRRSFSASLRTEYERINDIDGRTSREWFHRSQVRYNPNRRLKAEATLDYDDTQGDGISATSLLAEEEIVYSIYKINGLIRRLWEFSQEAEYELLDRVDTDRRSTAEFRVGANYYPLQVLRLSGEVGFKRVSPADYDQLIYDLGCRLSMSKLQVDLTYSYGLRMADETILADRNEQRWELSVKRVF